MAELKVNLKVKKTIWFYIAPFLSLIGCIKLLDGKPLAKLYLGKQVMGSVNFNISEFL